ncbi:MAG: sulfurtransferase TusA family protein [Candidatus Manganitrophus sp. SA1]|nr:sulfurtransferase TusA family protein [Candidatus Manganitrophus morganii]
MIVADQILDTLGLFCPIPVILTSKKIKQMEIDQVLEVLSDDEGIKKDMPAWCKSSGNEFLDLIQEGKVFKVYIRKKKSF